MTQTLGLSSTKLLSEAFRKLKCVFPLLRRPGTLKVSGEVLPPKAPRSHSPHLPHALVVGITSFFCDSLTLTFISLLLCDPFVTVLWQKAWQKLLKDRIYLGWWFQRDFLSITMRTIWLDSLDHDNVGEVICILEDQKAESHAEIKDGDILQRSTPYSPHLLSELHVFKGP